jgi:hypothetical protein
LCAYLVIMPAMMAAMESLPAAFTSEVGASAEGVGEAWPREEAQGHKKACFCGIGIEKNKSPRLDRSACVRSARELIMIANVDRWSIKDCDRMRLCACAWRVHVQSANAFEAAGCRQRRREKSERERQPSATGTTTVRCDVIDCRSLSACLLRAVSAVCASHCERTSLTTTRLGRRSLCRSLVSSLGWLGGVLC